VPSEWAFSKTSRVGADCPATLALLLGKTPSDLERKRKLNGIRHIEKEKFELLQGRGYQMPAGGVT
jgi:hypothetical protein